jgi:hypothetical protein
LSATLTSPELDAIDSTAGQLAALSRLKAEPDWLRAVVRTPPIGVDRERGIIYGRVLAEKGPFKSPGRGEFDDLSLDLITELAKEHPKGLKARFTHPALSSDGLGKFLGRDRNIRRDGDKVRGDTYLDPTALQTPPDGGGKPLGVYVMDLATSDPDALSSSLVLKTKQEYRQDDDGNPLRDASGNELPPLWRPTKLHACDVVDTGDAVHSGFLSADLPDDAVRHVAEALDSQFRNCDRATVESRGRAFLSRYLDLRFGDDDMGTETKPDGKPDTKPTEQRPTVTPGPSPELAAFLAEQKAALDAQAAAIKADLEAQREAMRLRAKAEDEMACLRQAQALCEKGTVTAAALDDSDPAAVPLGSFLHLLDNSTPVRTAKDAKGKDVAVTLRGAFLALLPTLRPQRGGERLSGPPQPEAGRKAALKAASDDYFKGRKPVAAG